MKRYVVLYSWCTRGGDLEQYKDGVDKVYSAVIDAVNTQQALRIFYEQEQFEKKPDYVAVIGGTEHEGINDIDE